MTDDYTQVPFGDDVAPGGFDLIEFADNPEPRCACVLVLDVSGSMNGVSLIALNAGLQQFATDVREDSLTARRVDLAVVTFGDTVNVVAEFGSAQHFYPQPLTAKGSTPMGEAINVSLDLMASRQQQYRSAGITPYRGVFFLVTDGKPTDSWERAARRIEEGERHRSFSFFAVGVDGADIGYAGQDLGQRPGDAARPRLRGHVPLAVDFAVGRFAFEHGADRKPDQSGRPRRLGFDRLNQ